jgi:hypothetical protein
MGVKPAGPDQPFRRSADKPHPQSTLEKSRNWCVAVLVPYAWHRCDTGRHQAVTSRAPHAKEPLRPTLRAVRAVVFESTGRVARHAVYTVPLPTAEWNGRYELLP